MKIGDKVCVCRDSWAYSGAFRGQYGVVKSFYHGAGGNVGVKLNDLYNKNSSRGLYYFNEEELLVVGTDVDNSFLNGLSNANPRCANPFTIKDVIFNDPAVIVLWNDGTKTVVKCSENDIFDPEKGLAMAISKKALGNQGNYYNIFRKYLAKEEEERESLEGLLAEFWDHVFNALYEKESK